MRTSMLFIFFFSSRRRHTRYIGDWSSDVCSSDLLEPCAEAGVGLELPILQVVPRLGAGTGEIGNLVARESHRSEERRVGKEGGDEGRVPRRTKEGGNRQGRR